jgi:hypothetical protein
MRPGVKRPAECSSAEVETFEDLLRGADEVDELAVKLGTPHVS